MKREVILVKILQLLTILISHKCLPFFTDDQLWENLLRIAHS